MNQPDRSDRSSVSLVRPLDDHRARRRQDRESGQAMVEFALILLPLLLLVAGIIQFGIALNYWLDMQRISNQGARWAVVNAYPGCLRTDPNTLSCGTSTSLQEYIACQPLPGALNPSVAVSFPAGGTPVIGDPVTVTVTSSFDLLPILGVGSIGLTGDTTMRLEQLPVRYSTADNLIEGEATCS
jgi:Flp pilus assembly protein TadG